MYFNLLPQQHKDRFRKEIYTKMLYTASVFVLVWGIILVGAIYVSSGYLNNKNEQLVKNIQEASADERNTEAVSLEQNITELNTLLRRIQDIENTKKYNFAQLLMRLAPMVPAGANLQEIDYSASSAKIFIRGHANQRTEVITFQNRLEDDDFFSIEDPPLSNLLKAEDINFSFTIILPVTP